MSSACHQSCSFPLPSHEVAAAMEAVGVTQIGDASIRQLVAIVNQLETRCETQFVRMEMGIPGLPPASLGVAAEIAALERGVAGHYPMLEGVPDLKQALAGFANNFLDLKLSPEHCFPTVGSMQGALASFLMANRMHEGRDATLFLDPGFPAQKNQLQILGQGVGSFDVYNHRGADLEAELERHLESGRYASILYSNPNNPTWVCFSEQELEIIGRMAKRYDLVVIEDMAYFGMDFRQDYGVPGKAPFQPAVGHYCDQYIVLLSSSKAFSYAGQRVAGMLVSGALYQRECANLQQWYQASQFGQALVFGVFNCLSSGVSHSAQYGLAALLNAANTSEYAFLEKTAVYGERAKHMKQVFTKHGFVLVYDQDNGQDLADGFYFTIAYPGMSAAQLLEQLVRYGISAISLLTTGSLRGEGLRACSSKMDETKLMTLSERLVKMKHDWSKQNP